MAVIDIEGVDLRQALKAEQAEVWRLLGERLELLTSEYNNAILIKKAS